ncbi:MAG: hypothetical protein CEE43_07630 [Promethearchaeota archaeon Loki_b32]|nr:MAG: hypothetical protein CEE43_07630 [Candidatus Lokiarchaeota archaeon Loki_b32]
MSENLVIIDVTDREHIILDGSQNLKEVSGKGTLVVKNPTQRSRLWNLMCDVKENVNTSLESKELTVGTLNPAQDFSKEYEIKDLKDSSLKVEEIFDTDKSDSGKVNNAFLYKKDNKCSLKLILTNPLNLPILDIKVKRDMPAFIQEIEMRNPSNGEANLKEEDRKQILSWELTSLDAENKAELEIFFTVNMKELTSQELGVLTVNYLINNYKLTMMNPEVRGLTDSMSGIDRDEGSQPGIWDCNVEFINESGFQVKLEDVKVSQTITTGVETVVSQTPDRVLNPDESWDFDFQVEAKDVPELSSEIGCTPLFVVIPRVIGEIIKESTVYEVLSATIEKTIDPPEVDAYANTNMTITNTIVNDGSSLIDKFFLSDELPPDFIPPLVKEIKILLADIDISSREEFVQKILIDPSDQDFSKKHQIYVELFNLSNEFLPGKQMVISYPLLARNPRPPTETKYMTPVKIDINSPVEGKSFVRSPDEEPELKVRYVKRKLKTLKSIKPGLTEGEFSIGVRVQNKGDVELENVLVKDIIPSSFSLTEFKPPEGATHEVVQVGDLSELHVRVTEIKGGASVSINYICSGSGHYPRSEPVIIVLGRGGGETSTSSDAPPAGTETPKAHVASSQAGKIHDLFIELYKTVDRAPTSEVFGNLLERKRDEFPPGPVLHQILAYAKELKALGEKIIVGSLYDEVMNKLKDFKSKYD